MIHINIYIYFQVVKFFASKKSTPNQSSKHESLLSTFNLYQAADFDEQTEQRACWPGPFSSGDA